MRSRIDVYRKPGCQLCDDAEDLLHDVSERFDFEVTRHSIVESQALFARYRYLVPVIRIDGVDRLSLRFDVAALEKALREAGVRQRPAGGSPSPERSE